MATLIDRARGLFGRSAPEVPREVPFELGCACGQQIAGSRTESRQFPICPSCGFVLLVLPVSAYPAVRVATEMVGVPTETRHSGQEPGASVPSRRRRTAERRRAIRDRAKRIHRVVAARLRAEARAARGPLITRGRIVAFGITATVILTTATVTWVSYHEYLRESLPAARDESLAALQAGNLIAARQAMDKVAHALRVLGAVSAESSELQQLAVEVALLADQVDQPMDDILAEADAAELQTWTRHFAAAYQNRAVVIDAFLAPPDPDNLTAGIQLDFAVFSGDRMARWDVSNVKLFDSLALTGPTRVFFGARLQSIAPDPAGLESDGPRVWVIRFDPESVCFMTSALALRAAAWPVDEPTHTLLRKQAAQLQHAADEPAAPAGENADGGARAPAG